MFLDGVGSQPGYLLPSSRARGAALILCKGFSLGHLLNDAINNPYLLGFFFSIEN